MDNIILSLIYYVTFIIVWSKTSRYLLKLYKDTFPWEFEHENIVILRQYILSFIHSIFATLTSIYLFFELIDENIENKYNCKNNVSFNHVLFCTAAFMAYLTVDTYFYMHVSNFKNLHKSTLLHHLMFFFASIVQICYSKSCFPFSWLYLGEISTIFLNLRWFLKQHKIDGLWKILVNILFIFFFFISRVVIYGYGLFKFFREDEDIYANSKSFWHITVILFSFGYILNLFWISVLIKRKLF